MSLNSRIKERREQLNLTRIELAEKIGVTSSAIANYENEISSPKVELLYKLFDALDCDANFLYQDEMKQLTYKDTATPEEFERIIKKYRSLDPYGQETVSMVLDREVKRSTTANEQYAIIATLENKVTSLTDTNSDFGHGATNHPTPIGNKSLKRTILYLHKLASAGTGEYLFDDIPSDLIEVPADSISENADFAVGVSGDSMTPYYRDGDVILVRKTSGQLPEGAVGLFIIDNEMYVKRVGKDELLSDNPKYKKIPFNSTRKIDCIGEVLGITMKERNLDEKDIMALHAPFRVW